MKLTDLDKKNTPVRALKENFNIDFNVSNLDRMKTRGMLQKVRGLINESRKSGQFHKTQNNPSYLKLMFMEQALTQHLGRFRDTRVIFENEEVEKSQVILAAQDMVDTVQKMYEDVNDMVVKELPALVDSIQSEIGANESEQFNAKVSEALTSLNSAMLETKNTLQSALNGLTGQGSPAGFGDEMMGAPEDDMADIGGEEDIDIGGSDLGAEPELPELPELPGEEPEQNLSAAGRAKR